MPPIEKGGKGKEKGEFKKINRLLQYLHYADLKNENNYIEIEIYKITILD